MTTSDAKATSISSGEETHHRVGVEIFDREPARSGPKGRSTKTVVERG